MATDWAVTISFYAEGDVQWFRTGLTIQVRNKTWFLERLLFVLKTIILPSQTRDKHSESTQKRDCFVFLAAALWMPERCEKRHFLRHLYIKTNILPRQARDKHKENSKKSGVFRRTATR
eukprot:COSAG06_NODE_640_length_13515_cov_6.190206_8_plen_119_part_00